MTSKVGTSELKRGTSELLVAARRGLSPTTVDQARVLQRLQATLARAPVGRADDAPDAPARAPATVRQWPWLGRIVALGAVAAVASGVGYRAGRRAERLDADARRTASVVVVPPTPVPFLAPESVAAPASASPVPTVAAHAPKETSHRAQPTRATAPITPNAQSLAEELRVLRGAERALRERHPGFALALLRELDHSVPNGQLTEERQAVRTIARCGSGDVPFGVNLAQDFAERYPGSVYDRRVTEACAATDSPSSGDQTGRRNR